jgi:hypothetical protein
MNHSLHTKVSGLVGALLLSSCVYSSEFPEYFSSSNRQSIQNWLMEHQEFRIATDQDCNCENQLTSYRKGGGAWPKNPNYHPYYVVGDFNQDSKDDLAVVFINRNENNKRYLAIFNGPLIKDSKPVYLEPEEFALFYGAPRPKPYVLIISEFNSEGVSLEPKGNGYAINEESEY